MEHCLEDVVKKLVVVKTPCGTVQGKLIDYDLGTLLVVEQADTTKCLVKDWIAIYIIDDAQRLRAFYRDLTSSKAISKQASSIIGRTMNERDRHELPSIHLLSKALAPHSNF